MVSLLIHQPKIEMKKEHEIEELDNAGILEIRGVEPGDREFGLGRDTGESLLKYNQADEDLYLSPYRSIRDDVDYDFLENDDDDESFFSFDDNYIECRWRKRNRHDRLERKNRKKHTHN